MAAGLRLATDNVPTFRQALIDYANERLTPADLVGVLDVDGEISLAQCDLELFQQIQRLAPFGRGNPEPRLLLRDVVLDGPPQCVGQKGAHLSLMLRQGDRRMRAIGFGMGELADHLASARGWMWSLNPRPASGAGSTARNCICTT